MMGVRPYHVLVPGEDGVVALRPLGEDLVVVHRHVAALQLVGDRLRGGAAAMSPAPLAAPNCSGCARRARQRGSHAPSQGGSGSGRALGHNQERASTKGVLRRSGRAQTSQSVEQRVHLAPLLKNVPLPGRVVGARQHDVVHAVVVGRAALGAAHVAEVLARHLNFPSEEGVVDLLALGPQRALPPRQRRAQGQ